MSHAKEVIVHRALASTSAAVAVGIMALLLLTPSAVQADAPPSASGAGHFTPATPAGSEYRTFSFNAKQHADGRVTGQAQLIARREQGDVVIHAELDCLRVVGNTATMSGVVKRAEGTPSPVPEGRPVTFSVVDNGEGADDPPDLISNFFLTPPSPFQGCNAALTPPPINTVENGNVQVRT